MPYGINSSRTTTDRSAPSVIARSFASQPRALVGQNKSATYVWLSSAARHSACGAAWPSLRLHLFEQRGLDGNAPGAGAADALPRCGRRVGQCAGTAELPVQGCCADAFNHDPPRNQRPARALCRWRDQLAGPVLQRRPGHLLRRVGPVLLGPQRPLRRATSQAC